MDKKASLQDTIQELKVYKKKQNAEIDELIVSLQTQAKIEAPSFESKR
jgi:dynactin complex subunit